MGRSIRTINTIINRLSHWKECRAKSKLPSSAFLLGAQSKSIGPLTSHFEGGKDAFKRVVNNKDTRTAKSGLAFATFGSLSFSLSLSLSLS